MKSYLLLPLLLIVCSVNSGCFAARKTDASVTTSAYRPMQWDEPLNALVVTSDVSVKYKSSSGPLKLVQTKGGVSDLSCSNEGDNLLVLKSIGKPVSVELQGTLPANIMVNNDASFTGKLLEIHQQATITASADATVNVDKISAGSLLLRAASDSRFSAGTVEAVSVSVIATSDAKVKMDKVDCTSLNLTAASDAEVTLGATAVDVQITATSDAKVKAGLECDQLNVVSATEADVTLTGSCTMANVSVASSATVNAEKFDLQGGSLTRVTDGRFLSPHLSRLTVVGSPLNGKNTDSTSPNYYLDEIYDRPAPGKPIEP